MLKSQNLAIALTEGQIWRYGTGEPLGGKQGGQGPWKAVQSVLQTKPPGG